MRQKSFIGSITIFLSLACILFLSLICAVTESARLQGARTQTANIIGMGTYSLLSEFESDLLDKYEIFALDGGRSGSFSLSALNAKLEEYLEENTTPKSGIVSSLLFDPWNLSLEASAISAYALLTDDKGEAFYQQAVSYMKANIACIALDKLLDSEESTSEIQQKESAYESGLSGNDTSLSNLESEKQEVIAGIESEAQESGETAVAETSINPLTVIATLRSKSTLELVVWDKMISEKSVTLSEQPSKNVSNTGTMSLEAEHSGLISNVLFREFLLMKFKNYTSGEDGASLSYQLEYILGGKASDKENLKYVVNQLLLLREGMNYAYLLTDTSKTTQAMTLATALTGFLGIPALTLATRYAILLAWAYGESLVDLRILLDGGKVPLTKTGSTWKLDLANLENVTSVLQTGATGSATGYEYADYLRILLNMGSLGNQKMRALDLVQQEIAVLDGMSSFRVENCIVGISTTASFTAGQVFFSLPGVVMGVVSGDQWYTQTASLVY